MDSESRDQPQTDFIYCNGAITELLKFGPCRLSAAHKLLFLVIPGNPGLVGFYRTFMQSLHSLLGYRHPVWAVSHAGHCDPPDTMDMTQDWSSEQDVFGLNGQVEHKLSFLRAQVPRDTGLVLVGHSIGCYIILDMMRRDPGLKVLKAVLLFPTIERMSASPQGQLMTPVLCHMRYAFYLPVFLLSLLPRSLLRVLASLVFSGVSCLDPCVVSPTVSLLTGDPAANAIYMGGQEMNQVLARDNVTIRQHLDKLVFYYGASDEWCPVQYYHDLKQDFPTGNIRLCEKGLRHAFVLDSGREVATMVLEWIRTDLHI